MLKFDLHVATESCADKNIERVLTDLGLKDDRLVQTHFNFYSNPTSGVRPPIGLHMSKKYDQEEPSEAPNKIRRDLKLIESLLKNHHITGYAHAELTRPKYDLLLVSNKGFHAHIPWPAARFQLVFSEKKHKWDIHIAIPVDELPAQLATILEQSGMYSIERLKARECINRTFRIYTIQGMSANKEGRALFDTLARWFRAVNAPYVEIKMETYIAMIKIGKPAIVPPTVNHVKFLSNQEHASQYESGKIQMVNTAHVPVLRK